MRKRGKALIPILLLLATSFICIGQVEPAHLNNDFSFSTSWHDYEALQVNPANIAANKRDDKKISFGLLQFNILMYSPVIKNRIFHSSEIGKSGIINTLKDEDKWIDEILVERTAANLDMTLFGINFHKKAGSFAISLNSHVMADEEVNGLFEELEYENGKFTNLTEVITKTLLENLESGGDPSQHSENSYLRASETNDINLGYSRRVLNTRKLKLFAGVNMKYILGLADIGIQYNENQVIGYYALSNLLPPDLEQYNAVNEAESNKKFGHGFGTGIGIAMKLKDLRVGLSVMDMGFIKWPSKSIYITQKDALGFIGQDDINQAIGEVVSDFQRKKSGLEMLPTKFVLGASYSVHPFVQFYFDMATPMCETTRNLTNTIAGIGTSLSLKGYLTIKAGPTLLNKKLVTFPMYLSLFSGKNKSFEIRFGTSDLISFFKYGRDYVQGSVALMKFHF